MSEQLWRLDDEGHPAVSLLGERGERVSKALQRLSMGINNLEEFGGAAELTTSGIVLYVDQETIEAFKSTMPGRA